jgi:hypothetical protein
MGRFRLLGGMVAPAHSYGAWHLLSGAGGAEAYIKRDETVRLAINDIDDAINAARATDDSC